MLNYLQRFVEAVRPGRDGNATTLQLRMLVAMAYADERLGAVEISQLESFVDRHARTDREHERLYALLNELIDSPPRVDDVLDELYEHADERRMGARLVHELSELAGVDDSIDHREGVLLDMVCDTFGLARPALDDHEDAASALYDLVHRMALVDRRAA